jgi:flagellar assembly factor FliW
MENSKKMGEAGIGTDLPLHFSQGLLGFEEISQYTLRQKGDGPVWELKVVPDGNPRFVLFEAGSVADRYVPALPRDVLALLGTNNPEDLSFFAVAVVPADIAGTTVNLRSPIVVNFKAGLAAQVVLESTGYPMRHPVFPVKGGCHTCS